MVKETKQHISRKTIIIALVIAGVLIAGATTALLLLSGAENIETMLAQWPSYFEDHSYVEPEFVDDENRDNNAFNIADFGKQGNNGWFYRYAKSTKLLKSMQIEGFNGERYFQRGVDGMEIKKDFIHTGKGVAPVLEWRVAQTGKINVKLTYVKDVNGDSNPGYPDGVCIYIYKGEELLESHQVPVYVDKQTLLETNIDNLSVTEDESLYFIVNPQSNNAYDGGQLYVAIMDVNAKPATAKEDNQRIDNNANNKEDYGYQGQNGWCYMYGKDVENSALVSTETEDGYINNTSPALTISKDFIHPAINDDAIISWTPARSGLIEVRAKYTKFEQNDGNPDWPDGVVVSAYLNNKKLFEKQVAAPDKGTEIVHFREENLQVTPNDRLYFVVSANGNSSYDGGDFDISIMDRNGRVNENAITVKESDTRQNFASVKDDFGEQGNNGWFFQEGYQDEPFGAYNIVKYVKDDKYVDDRYLEIKRDYVNVGERGESAVIKWKVAQDGDIKIDASYTKLKNEDVNPSWPDGTRVTLYHNSTVLARQEFAPEVSKEVTKNLNVSKLSVKRGDYITMVINGKDNNAYDGGKYTFSISSVSGLVGATENDVTIPNDANRTNNANVLKDFGQQGANGWFYQYGYYTDPFFAINVEKYENNDKYYTSDGIEIKRDYIMPSTKGKSANVKWKVAQDGVVNVYADYTKLINEDANPSWPDGTVVTLLHNSRVLKSEFFAADTKREIKKDLSVFGLNVKKGDYITLIVHGKDNTAYDGGLYSFEIEDATIVAIDRKNDNNENRANLENDFGEQGSNGWYYMEGRNPEVASALLTKTEDNAGYKSDSESDLQIKRDFVQPGVRKAAMYQWVAAVDGKIDVLGKYIKFGHNDGNPSWPDGTRVRIYLNNSLLFEKKVAVKQGDGNDNSILIELRERTVKKGDILTFAIDALDNNAWDGGRLKIQIKPYEKEPEYKNDSGRNSANLASDFGDQGSNGWYYGYGNDGSHFTLTDRDGEAYKSILYDNLELKRDGVQPSMDVGAIYRWVAATDGKIDLRGAYYKFRNENAEDKAPDGVKVEVYLNGKLVDGMSYDVNVSTTEEISQKIEKAELEVKAGDLIDFVITAKANNAWDYGKLEMSITSNTVYKNESGKNVADLFKDFIDGMQGSNGWYYGYGSGGNDFSLAEKWMDNEWRFTSDACNVTLKKDGVEPAENAGAIYRWVAAADGKITLAGTYYKNKHEDPNPSWPDGVKVEVFLNGKLVEGMSYDVNVSTTEEISQKIEKSGLEVKAGDFIDFVISAKANSAWDYGKLEMSITSGTEYKNESGVNIADLFKDFIDGMQGSNGWYYGYGSGGNNFTLAEKWMDNEWRFTSDACNVTLKKDGVEPAENAGAIYRWVAAADGKITLAGTYYKNKHEDPNPSWPDGVKVEVYLNGKLVEGMSYDVNVSTTEEISQKIEKSGLEVKAGDFIDFVISAKANSAWDYGKLEMSITSGTEYKNESGKNIADLFKDFIDGMQGVNGWYYGYGSGGNNFTLAEKWIDNEWKFTSDACNVTLKKDGVEPAENAGAIYRWVAAKDGKIDLKGTYYKNKHEDPNPSWPDGVKVEVFLNGKLVEGMSYDVNVSTTEEISQKIEKSGLGVKAGDFIDFVITAKANSAWDYGKLEMSISENSLISAFKIGFVAQVLELGKRIGL